MRNNYDFSKGVKNPYADKLKKGYTVTVHYDFAQNDNSGDGTHENVPADKQQTQVTTRAR